MKKYMLLTLLLVVLVGCDVKDKMVIQYGDYEETVLAERVESELGFVMDVIHGVEYQEDLDARSFEIVEPYSLSITVRDDVENIDDLYWKLREENRYRDPKVGRENSVWGYHPNSARLPYFDLFIIGEGTEDAIFYLIKEAEVQYYVVQFTIPTVNQPEQFSEIRSMLATFEIPGYESEARYYLQEAAYLHRFVGYQENVTINHFRYYEEDKDLSMYADVIPSIVGDPAIPYIDESEFYVEKLLQEDGFQPPTGQLLRRYIHNRDQEAGYIYYSSSGINYMDSALRFNIHQLVPPYHFNTRLLFGFFREGLEDVHLLEEKELVLDYAADHFSFDYVGEEDIYYFLYVEFLDEDNNLMDSMVEIVHVPAPAINISLSLEKDNIRPGEELQLHIINGSTYSIIGNAEYKLEKFENGEWWTIPFDGYFDMEYFFGNHGSYNSPLIIDQGEELIVDNMSTKGLEEGEYRIVQEFTIRMSVTGNYFEGVEEIVLSVPFTIEESINSK